MIALRPAPPLVTSGWINTPRSLSLEDFRGRVLVIEAFQMLCPGCVSHGLPLAQRVARAFDPADIAVIGLHTVFEHREAQGSRAAIEAFAHEYRLDFPIGIDAQAPEGGLPLTMRAYSMQGTPTLVVVDRQRRRRLQTFGHVDELKLGAALGTLLGEPSDNAGVDAANRACTADGCAVPPV